MSILIRKVGKHYGKNKICKKCGRQITDYSVVCKSCSLKGKSLSEEHRRRLSKSHKGHTPSKETRRKMSEARKGKYLREQNPAWKGGTTRHLGRVFVYDPDSPMSNCRGYVPRHRLVMSKALKRPLTSEEVVHHRNGIKDDDRLENLELFQNGADHTRFHRNEKE